MDTRYCFSLLMCLVCLCSAAPPLGANLDGVADWSRSLQFVDVIKSSRYPFGSPQTPWDGAMKGRLDSSGWPTSDFGVVISTTGVTNQGGVYSVSYIGQPCKITNVASSATASNFKYDATTHTTTCDLTVAATNNQLMLAFTNTSGGVKQLSIRRPGYKPTDMFTTPFLAQLQRFTGPLRFMDWGATNDNPVMNWTTRGQPTDAQWTRVGVPWEAAIALCNQLQKDIWVNVPAMVDDDYVKQLVMLLQSQLNKNLRVYVEYSNEVWNWQFQQAHWNLAEAQNEVKAGNSPLNYNNDNNIYYWGYRRVALRLYQISNTFASVWGAQAINTRVFPVLAGQVVNPIVAQVGLDMIQAVYGPPSKYFHAVAGAPYFGFHDKDSSTNLTVDEIIKYMNDSIQGMKTATWMKQTAQLAAKYNLQFFSYEGGPDTFGPNNIAAKKAASLDPRMEALCVDYLSSMWFGQGYGVFNWFTAGATNWDTQYGTWGLTYDPAVLDTAKLKGINKVLGI